MVIGEMTQQTDLVVIGAGPGGYTAALRAAQLGIKTILVDSQDKLGGVCLHEGCIPSKALLHAAEVIDSAKRASTFGLHYDQPKLDLAQLRAWKDGVVNKLAAGIAAMCKSSQVEILTGTARFEDSATLRVDRQGEGVVRLKFKHAILATGSRAIGLPKLFKNPEDINNDRILDTAGALFLKKVPESLLIIGGGYIGLEMGTVYAALGCEVTVVEITDGLLPGVDVDLVKPLANSLQSSFKQILLNTEVVSLNIGAKGVECLFKGNPRPDKAKFDSILIAVGRRPNSDNIGLGNTAVELDERGFVKIDQSCRTADKRIFAIGDVSGQPMLAHRAMRQGHVASEVLAGMSSSFDNRAIPAVIFTEPEIAFCGLTETEAKASGEPISVARFPWSASGRAMTLANPIGHTKVIYKPDSMRVVGVGMVGVRAGELIAEGVLAIESGAVLEDLAVTIHPHPTLSETIGEASMIALSRAQRQRPSLSPK